MIGRMVVKPTHIVSHVAHQARSEIQKHGLKIYHVPSPRCVVQRFFGVGKNGRQDIFNESLQIGITKKAKSSLSLSLPQFSVGVNDATS